MQNNYDLHVDDDHVHHNNNECVSRDDNIESLRSALHRVCLENEQLWPQLSAHNDELESVCNKHDMLQSVSTSRSLQTLSAELELRLLEVSPEVLQLTAALNKQTEKTKRFWMLRCKQMLKHNEAVKAMEIASLCVQLAIARALEDRSMVQLP